MKLLRITAEGLLLFKEDESDRLIGLALGSEP